MQGYHRNKYVAGGYGIPNENAGPVPPAPKCVFCKKGRSEGSLITTAEASYHIKCQLENNKKSKKKRG